MSQKLFLRKNEIGNADAFNNILNKIYQRIEALEALEPGEVNVSFTTGGTVEETFPIPCACPVAKPTRVKTGAVRNLTNPTDIFYEASHPDWSFANGVIWLNYVGGLTVNTRYLLTLEVSGNG